MVFRASKIRFIFLLTVMVGMLTLLVQRNGDHPWLWGQVIALLLVFGVILAWLSRFEIRIDGDRTEYRSLWGGKILFDAKDIKQIRINKYDELTHLIFSRHTLFIDLKSGRQAKINTRIFPPQLGEILVKRGWPVRK